MVIRVSWYPIFAVLMTLLCLLGGCNTTNTIAPFSPEIVNKPDSFSFQITDARSVTWVHEYLWTNSGTMASVDQSPSAGASGTATLTLLDNSGTTVLVHDLKVDGVYDSQSGVNGQWKIRVAITSYSGTLNFRVQKK